ncbi:hypothetical protein G6F63_016632 [Rhizopus arrhizus]|nr:hypothetical protein G6F63_016632 [Rhizopus arrhizus]
MPCSSLSTGSRRRPSAAAACRNPGEPSVSHRIASPSRLWLSRIAASATWAPSVSSRQASSTVPSIGRSQRAAAWRSVGLPPPRW